jgi:hypothetical protein
MAFSEDDITAIDAVLQEPERVRFADGREVQNRSVDEILKVRRTMQAEVGKPDGTKRVRQLRMYSGKGL